MRPQGVLLKLCARDVLHAPSWYVGIDRNLEKKRAHFGIATFRKTCIRPPKFAHQAQGTCTLNCGYVIRNICRVFPGHNLTWSCRKCEVHGEVYRFTFPHCCGHLRDINAGGSGSHAQNYSRL